MNHPKLEEFEDNFLYKIIDKENCGDNNIVFFKNFDVKNQSDYFENFYNFITDIRPGKIQNNLLEILDSSSSISKYIYTDFETFKNKIFQDLIVTGNGEDIEEINQETLDIATFEFEEDFKRDIRTLYFLIAMLKG
ncbi:hypothetical protein [uncultured Flavobacterium sp.]|uniref:hypothetical protein n=1 Tax=uncultured Flavobacterium sp. TaxID=165435 RepID=UPI0030EB9165|tara:strand:+ start:27782 stop:28189 length:408 start_codon:yes stop_codon:yes gene_type:complete